MKKIIAIIVFFSIFVACSSTQSSLKNVNDNAPSPTLKNYTTFLITEYSKDKKYGYNPDYPINIFYGNSKNDSLNQQRFLNALAGPKGELINYTKLESCCPFPTKRSEMGAGFLDVYELKWTGQQNPIKLYLNIYEKGVLLIPVGLSHKKN